ncbi:hypothetical protein KDL01_08225 [Actinospica durhamensis]|uniref:ABC transporter permease n=1 Tax=Actinospica durhamensis TaxID=1508375 RepID=A0A941IQT0_9ACTN|nr:hypothetical protein [Actinospica durhamensis]MBR7833248.1 hypothetical protein [Actinospica durhamensis]
MSSLAPTAPGAERVPGRTRPRLHGLTWLVWRQHRASFRFWTICALLLTGYLVYLHTTYASYLSAQAAGFDPDSVAPDAGFSVAAFLLSIAPLLAGASFGTQLFEREFSDGTFALVCTQSVSRVAWVRTKLLVPALMIVLCVAPCAAALTWDYSLDPHRQQIFLGREIFEAIGPAAVALSLVGLLVGAAAGLTLWRTGAAPVLAFLVVLAFKLCLWALPGQLNQEADSSMQTLQWTTTGICVVVCAGLAAYCQRLIVRRPS